MFSSGAHVSDCGRYLVLTPIKGCKNNLVYFARIDPQQKVTEKLQLHSVVTEFEADYEYVTNNGSKFIFRTNKDAPNYRLVVIDFNDPDPTKWTELIPEHSKDVLDWAKAINNNNLIVCYLSDVKVSDSLFDVLEVLLPCFLRRILCRCTTWRLGGRSMIFL